MKKESHSMYCTKCGNRGLDVCRTGKGKTREKGHLKKLWCINCKEEVNHAEISNNYTIEMFRYEFEHNNFVDGERIVSVDTMIKKFYEEN